MVDGDEVSVGEGDGVSAGWYADGHIGGRPMERCARPCEPMLLTGVVVDAGGRAGLGAVRLDFLLQFTSFRFGCNWRCIV